MQIVFGLLFLLFFSACCLCVAACTRFDAALLPLPALCGSAVVLYLLSLLGLLQFGHFIIMAVWLAGGVYFGVRAGWRAIRRALFSPGFLLFVGGSCFLWVLFALQQPMFTQWDEFTAWGLAPKMVAERAALYVADPINLTASFTYPATSLVSYLFQRVPGRFYEWQCLAGLDILFLACIAPAAAMPRKNWAGAVLVFAAGFLLPFFFSVVPAGTPSTMYANAMADTPLALLFGGTLCLYAAAGGRKTGFFACAMPLAVLTMTKDIGFAYALIVTFLIGLDQLFGTPHPDTKPARIFGVSLAKCSILAAVVLAAILGGSSGSGQHRPLPDGDGDNPSSIVDIFGSKTTIPKIQGDPGVRLACRDPQGQPLTAQEVYAKVNPSVVTVVSEQSEGASIGTGVIMTSDGYIITNAHVISGGKSCWVALDTGVTYEVNLVGFDEEEDLAVLKADPQNPLPAAEFGNSDLVQVGDTAYAIGNPLGVELRGTMTSGIISAVNRAVEVDGKTMTLLQTSAALNNGNSGGPLINEYGQVIGINTLKMSTTDSTEATVEGLGFALPISSVSFVVNDLIANGHYRGAPSLGITVTTVERDGGGTQVQVMEVSAGSGAADAGIRAGDVILAADGQAVSVTSDLLTARRSHIIGDTVTLTILRDGQQFDVEVTLRSNRSFG